MANTPRLQLPEPQAGDSMNVNPPFFKTTWQNVDAAIGPTFCTSSTKPASPYACMWIYLTDQNVEQIWDPVANAWITLIATPVGIVASTNTANPTTISAAGTIYLCTSLNGLTVETFRNYRIHVEGTFSYTSNANWNVQRTEKAIASIVTSTTGNVTAASPILQSQYVDAWAYDNNVTAQRKFTFEGVYNSGANANLNVGWTIEVTPAFNSGGSNFSASNILSYVERA